MNVFPLGDKVLFQIPLFFFKYFCCFCFRIGFGDNYQAHKRTGCVTYITGYSLSRLSFLYFLAFLEKGGDLLNFFKVWSQWRHTGLQMTWNLFNNPVIVIVKSCTWCFIIYQILTTSHFVLMTGKADDDI